jgi:hypothetical protein
LTANERLGVKVLRGSDRCDKGGGSQSA